MRRFVGDASHELRTPLVSVRGYAELYRMGALQRPTRSAQAMDRIEKETIRIGGLVEDLLALARLDEAKPLELAEIDLVPLARDAALDTMAATPPNRHGHRYRRSRGNPIRLARGLPDLEVEVELDPTAARTPLHHDHLVRGDTQRLRGRRPRERGAVRGRARARAVVQAGSRCRRGIRGRLEARSAQSLGRVLIPVDAGARSRVRGASLRAVGRQPTPKRVRHGGARRREQDAPGPHESHGQRDPVHLG